MSGMHGQVPGPRKRGSVEGGQGQIPEINVCTESTGVGKTCLMSGEVQNRRNNGQDPEIRRKGRPTALRAFQKSNNENLTVEEGKANH